MEIPRHIAIIMDGNGRWAYNRGLPRSAGHKAGVDRLNEIIAYANTIQLPYLTLFAFSSENWQRPEREVRYLLELLEFFIKRDLKKLHKEGICIKIIGRRDNLSTRLKNLLTTAESLTQNNKRLQLNVAFNYGSQDEILRAVKALIEDAQQNVFLLENLTTEIFSSYLDTKTIPDPDLIIRTGGELRLSNFLLWQAAYSEFYFCQKFWPDFSKEDFALALLDYQRRERRYGQIKNNFDEINK